MNEYLSKVPKKVQEIILNLAASQGLNNNDYSNAGLTGFIEGAVAMYFFQQSRINALEVEIDLLEGETMNDVTKPKDAGNETPREMFISELRRLIVRLDEINKATPWQAAEPLWWLEMSAMERKALNLVENL